ncbi:retrovirus-related pol polyprotein from transposon TNT 1-94 [Tanacetum coccineum]
MSNSNTNLQTQSSNALHNAIMEAGSKDRPQMLAPVNSSTIVSKIHHARINGLRRQFQLLKVVLKQLQRGIDNDIYSTVDACPNACEMWKAIERLKQGESINMMNELVRNQCHVTNHQVNVQFLLQLQLEWQRLQQSTRNRGKVIVTSSAPTYDPEPDTVTEDDKIRANQDNSLRINKGTGYDSQRAVNVAGARENVGTPVVQKSRIQCYNCKEYGHVSRECQKPKRVKDAAYHKEKMLLCKQEEVGVQLNAEQADWKDYIMM